MQSHMHKVYECLAVTCHLHFWQNDQDLLHATAVTWGWKDTKMRVSTESRPWRRKFSHRSWRDFMHHRTWVQFRYNERGVHAWISWCLGWWSVIWSLEVWGLSPGCHWGGSSRWWYRQKSFIYLHKNDLRIASDCIDFDLMTRRKRFSREGMPPDPPRFQSFSFKSIPMPDIVHNQLNCAARWGWRSSSCWDIALGASWVHPIVFDTPSTSNTWFWLIRGAWARNLQRGPGEIFPYILEWYCLSSTPLTPCLYWEHWGPWVSLRLVILVHMYLCLCICVCVCTFMRMNQCVCVCMFVDHFYMALFSALRLTVLLAHVTEWVTVAFYNTIFFDYPSKWYAYSAICVLHSWNHVKLLFCVCHTTMHHFTVSLDAKWHR